MDQKPGEEKQNQFSSIPYIWDCGSTLYDSYELRSFKRQLDSAIANSPRTLSMPHLRSLQPPPRPPPPSSSNNKISRTFQKLLRFVFKSSSNNKFRICGSASNFQQVAAADHYKYSVHSNSRDRLYVVYDKSDQAVLSTIPEVPEFEIGGISPKISSLVTKSASERFTATSIGISCA